MIVSRRTFVATGASLSLLTLAACSSSPVDKAEQADESAAPATTTPQTPAAPATEAPAATASGDVEFYDGSQVPPLGPEPLLNPDGLQDRPIGGKGAKVIVIEYAAPTCSHCAAFAVDVFPEFKAKYIDTGKITFVLRPFLLNTLDAVVFMLAEAAGSENYHKVLDTYFHTTATWAYSDKPRDEIEKIALQLGFTEESFEAALTNQELFDGLNAVRQQALDKFGVTGTPSFFINGKMFSGGQSMDTFAAEIDPLLG